MHGALCLDKDTLWRRMPALQSVWFVPHVTAYVVSYALATVAMTMTVARHMGARHGHAARQAEYAVAIRALLRLAFPLMTFGLCSGALWADQAWATYWSWDPKETWSLITWLLYAIALHCHTRPGLRHYADTAQMLAFAALAVTFLVVNLVPRFGSALHGYA